MSRFTRASRAIAESGWVAFGQIAFAITSLVGLRGLTEFLSPAIYGQLALAMTFVMLFNQCAFGPLSGGLSRFYSQARSDERLGELRVVWGRSTRKLSLVAVLVGCGVALAAYVGTSAPLGAALIVASLVSVAVGIDSTAEALNTAARRRRLVSLAQAGRGMFRFGGAIVGAFSYGTSAGALVGYLVGAGVVALVHTAFTTKAMVSSGDRSSIDSQAAAQRGRDLRSYAWPFAVWGLFTWVQFASDRWALELFAGTEAVGLYNAVFQLGHQPIVLGAGIIMAYGYPFIFDVVQKNSRKANRATISLVAITAAATIAVLVLAIIFQDVVANLLLASAYHEAIRYMPFMVLGAGLFACGHVLSLIPLAAMKSRSLLLPAMITSTIGASLTFAFAARWGIGGVVAANAIYGLSHFCAMAVVSYKVSRAGIHPLTSAGA